MLGICNLQDRVGEGRVRFLAFFFFSLSFSLKRAVPEFVIENVTTWEREKVYSSMKNP